MSHTRIQQVARLILTAMCAACPVAAFSMSVSAARAQSAYLDQANQQVESQGSLIDVADRLFPMIAAMDPLPPGTPLVRDASILAPGAPAWASWSAWAEAPAQQSVIAALIEVTGEGFRGLLGFPYGREGVDEAWIEAGLYVDLGSPPVLAMARDHMSYLDRFDDVAKLCTVEATRRAEAGDGAGSMEVLRAWLGLARYTLERIFFLEKKWGMTHGIISCERMCDIAHTYPDLMNPALIGDVTDSLDPRNLRSDRFQFPFGEQLALEELLRLTIEERGGPKAGELSALMGRLEAGERGLLAFGGANSWASAESEHAGWFDTEEQINKIFGDWVFRWRLNDEFDARLRLESDYSKMDKARFSIVDRIASGLDELFDLRTSVKVAVTGTRSALGVVGYKQDHGQWPQTLAAVQPRFVAKLDYDPWNFNPANEMRDVFNYFVPIRDQPRGPREDPKPHVITVNVGSGETGLEGGPSMRPDHGPFLAFTADAFRDALKGGIPSRLWDPEANRVDAAPFKTYLEAQVRSLNIEIQTMNGLVSLIQSFSESQVRSVIALVHGTAPGAGGDAGAGPGEGDGAAVGGTGPRTIVASLDEEVFMVYSVGSDSLRQQAQNVGVGGTDVLIWPPLLSLQREH